MQMLVKGVVFFIFLHVAIENQSFIQFIQTISKTDLKVYC